MYLKAETGNEIENSLREIADISFANSNTAWPKRNDRTRKNLLPATFHLERRNGYFMPASGKRSFGMILPRKLYGQRNRKTLIKLVLRAIFLFVTIWVCWKSLVAAFPRPNSFRAWIRKQDVRITVVDDFQFSSFDYAANERFMESCTSEFTVVTAYYDLGDQSKYSSKQYLEWNSRFFSLNDNMIIYTDRNCLDSITVARRQSKKGCTLIVIQPVQDTEIFGLVDWTRERELDPERHIHEIELYIIWNQKAIWLEQVANINPYQSGHFFWADSGQFRDSVFTDAYLTSDENWVKTADFLPSCHMLLLSIEHFLRSELSYDDDHSTTPLTSDKVRLGGGNLGGDACAVRRFVYLFRMELRHYVKKNFFIGKDQPIFGSICTTWRDVCFIVDAYKVSESPNPWFALQPVLHGATRPVPQYVLQLGSVASFMSLFG